MKDQNGTNFIIGVLLLILLQGLSPADSRYRSRFSHSSEVTTSWNLSSYSFLPKDCGEDLSEKIFGGVKADLFDFPWLVLLEYKHEAKRTISLACGGVLISKRYVMTAAHCTVGKVEEGGWKLVSARLGEYDKSTKADCINYSDSNKFCADPPLSIEIEEKIVHQDYNPTSATSPNDIALLRLSHDVSFTTYIRPICLPENAEIKEEYFHVGGWGRTENGKLSDVKLKVKIPMVNDTRCKSTDSQLCAGAEEGRDSCSGDSGGPLMEVNMNSRGTLQWTAIGIVSFGPKPCGQKDRPGVYTRVSSFMPWILSKMRN